MMRRSYYGNNRGDVCGEIYQSHGARQPGVVPVWGEREEGERAVLDKYIYGVSGLSLVLNKEGL